MRSPFIALVAFSITAAHAQAPLTLPEAQRLAVDRSRQLSAQDSAVLASRELALAAKRLPDPVLRIGVDNLPVDGSDRFSFTRDFMTMRRIGLMQELTASDKLDLRSERFELEARKSLAEQSASLAAIQRDTALAWLERFYAEASARLLEEQRTRARQELEAAEAAYRGGRGSQADVFAARGAVAMMDDRVAEFERRVRTAKAMLARWIGPAAEFALTDKPATDSIRIDVRALENELVHHPGISVLSAQEQIAATEAKLAQANRTADWSVELAYQQRGSAYSNMVSIGVSVPLPWDRANRQDRELAAKLALVDQSRAQREEQLREHVAEVRAKAIEWESNRERLVRFEREIIPLARERADAVMASYRGGKATLAESLGASRGEIELRLQALQLELEAARLWAQLNFLFPLKDAGR